MESLIQGDSGSRIKERDEALINVRSRNVVDDVAKLKMSWLSKTTPEILKGGTIIVGAAGVGQMSAELISTTLKMEPLARFWHASLPPLAGESAEPCILLGSPDGYAVMLFRTEPRGRFEDFIGPQIVELFKQWSPKQIVVLTDADGSENTDFTNEPIRYVCNNATTNKKALMASACWGEYSTEKHIYGARFSQDVYNQCCDRSVPCLLVFRYSYGGFDVETVLKFTEKLTSWLKIPIREKPILPRSWGMIVKETIPDMF